MPPSSSSAAAPAIPAVTITVVPKHGNFDAENPDPFAEPEHDETETSDSNSDASDDWERMSTVSLTDDAATALAIAEHAQDADLRVSLLPPEQKLSANKDSPYKPHPDTYMGRIRFYLSLPPTPPLYETVEVFLVLIVAYGLVVALGLLAHNGLPSVDRFEVPMNFSKPPLPHFPRTEGVNSVGATGFNVSEALLANAYLASLGPHPYNSPALTHHARRYLAKYLRKLRKHARKINRTLQLSDDLLDRPPPLVLVDAKSSDFGMGTFYRPNNLAVRLLGSLSESGVPAPSILLTSHMDTPTLSPGSTSPSGLGLGASLALLSSLLNQNPLDSDVVLQISGFGVPASHLPDPGSQIFRGDPHPFYPATRYRIHLVAPNNPTLPSRPVLNHVTDPRLVEAWAKVSHSYAISPLILDLGTSGTSYDVFADGEGEGMLLALSGGGLEGSSADGMRAVRVGGIRALGENLEDLIRILDGGSEVRAMKGDKGEKSKVPRFWRSEEPVYHHFLGRWLWYYTARFYIWGLLGTLVAIPLAAITLLSLFAYLRQGATAYQVWTSILSPFLTQTLEILYSLLSKFGKLPTGLKAAEGFWRLLRSTGALLLGISLTAFISTLAILIIQFVNPSIAYAGPGVVWGVLAAVNVACLGGGLLLWERRDYVFQRAELKERMRKAEMRARGGRGEDEGEEEDYDSAEEEAEEPPQKKKGKKKKDKEADEEGGKKGKKNKGKLFDSVAPSGPPVMSPEGVPLLPAPSLEPQLIRKTLSAVGGGPRPLEQDRFNHLLQAINVYFWAAVFFAFYAAVTYSTAVLYGVWLWALFYLFASGIDYGVGFLRLSKIGAGWWKRLNWAVLIVPAFVIPGIPFVDYLLLIGEAITAPLGSVADHPLPNAFTLGWQFALLGSPLFVVAIPWMARSGRVLELTVLAGVTSFVMLVFACTWNGFGAGRPFRVEVGQVVGLPVATNPSKFAAINGAWEPESTLIVRPVTVGWRKFEREIRKRFPDAVVGKDGWTIPGVEMPRFWGHEVSNEESNGRPRTQDRHSEQSVLGGRRSPISQPPIAINVTLSTKPDKKTNFITAHVRATIPNSMGICRAKLGSVWTGRLSGKWKAVTEPFISEGDVKAGCCGEWDILGGPDPALRGPEWLFDFLVSFPDPANKTLPGIPVATGTIECFLDALEFVPAVKGLMERLPDYVAVVGKGMGLVTVREGFEVHRI